MNTETHKTNIKTNTKINHDAQSIKEQINNNDAFAIRCMMKVYEYQTTSEQTYKDTHEENNVGFSGADAEILSSFAEQVKKWQHHSNGFKTPLSEKQLILTRRKMCKYTRQLLTILTTDDYNIESYKEQAPKSQTPPEIMTMRVIKLQFPRQYSTGIKFYLELRSEDNNTVRTMIDVNSIDNPNRTVPKIGDSVRVSGNIKNGWLYVTKDCHYSIIRQSTFIHHSKIEAIRANLTNLKDSINIKTYNKVWEAMNELESELSPHSSKPESKSPTKPKPQSNPKPETITKPTPKSTDKPTKKQNLSDLLKEFEEDKQ